MLLYGPEIAADSEFPDSPIAGRLVFKDKRLYIAAELVSGVPVWVPLTNEINGYVHNETTAATTWSIQHDLNSGAPLVQIYDEDHEQIIPDTVVPDDNNNLTVTFSSAMAGIAVVMAYNDASGSDRSDLQFAYEQSFTTSTTVVVTHNLGYYPIIRVFIGTQEVQPQSIVHDSIMQATITFSSSQTGTVRAI